MRSIFRRKRQSKVETPQAGPHEDADFRLVASPKDATTSYPSPSYNEFTTSTQHSEPSYNQHDRSVQPLASAYVKPSRSNQTSEYDNPSSNAQTKPKKSLGSLLRKYSNRRGGYNGVLVRRARSKELAQTELQASEIYTHEIQELPAIEEDWPRRWRGKDRTAQWVAENHASDLDNDLTSQKREENTTSASICLQCGQNRMNEALLDRNIIDGNVVGICHDCYPGYLQFLELQAADADDDTALALLSPMINSESPAETIAEIAGTITPSPEPQLPSPTSSTPFQSNNPYLTATKNAPAPPSRSPPLVSPSIGSPITGAWLWNDSNNEEDSDNEWDSGNEWDSEEDIEEEEEGGSERNHNSLDDNQVNSGNEGGLIVVSKTSISPAENINSNDNIGINDQDHQIPFNSGPLSPVPATPSLLDSAKDSPEAQWPLKPAFEPETKAQNKNSRRVVTSGYEFFDFFDTQSTNLWDTPPVVMRDCNICGDAQAGEQFLPATLECDHDIDYCRQCLKSWIISQMDTKRWDKITCPETQCRKTLDASDIQRGGDRETYQK
jgi:Zinc finger, C3HC4 type (RING finger)